MPLKKPSVTSGQSSTMPNGESLGTWGKRYPAVCEFLSASVWEDGSSRELGSLILFWAREDGYWRVCLNCKDSSRVCFVSGDSPEAALANAQKGLESDRLDWRASKGPGGKRRS